MGILPARESFVANMASALDCKLIIPPLNEGGLIGQTTAWSYVATTSAPLKVRYLVGNGCVGATAGIAETVRRTLCTHRDHEQPGPGEDGSGEAGSQVLDGQHRRLAVRLAVAAEGVRGTGADRSDSGVLNR